MLVLNKLLFNVWFISQLAHGFCRQCWPAEWLPDSTIY